MGRGIRTTRKKKRTQTASSPFLASRDGERKPTGASYQQRGETGERKKREETGGDAPLPQSPSSRSIQVSAFSRALSISYPEFPGFLVSGRHQERVWAGKMELLPQESCC